MSPEANAVDSAAQTPDGTETGPAGSEKPEEEAKADTIKTEEVEGTPKDSETDVGEIKMEEGANVVLEDNKADDQKSETSNGVGAETEETPKSEKKECPKASKTGSAASDSDSSATCSADEMDEQDPADKTK